jgi:hypothetical protein
MLFYSPDFSPNQLQKYEKVWNYTSLWTKKIKNMARKSGRLRKSGLKQLVSEGIIATILAIPDGWQA